MESEKDPVKKYGKNWPLGFPSVATSPPIDEASASKTAIQPTTSATSDMNAQPTTSEIRPRNNTRTSWRPNPLAVRRSEKDQKPQQSQLFRNPRQTAALLSVPSRSAQWGPTTTPRGAPPNAKLQQAVLPSEPLPAVRAAPKTKESTVKSSLVLTAQQRPAAVMSGGPIGNKRAGGTSGIYNANGLLKIPSHERQERVVPPVLVTPPAKAYNGNPRAWEQESVEYMPF